MGGAPTTFSQTPAAISAANTSAVTAANTADAAGNSAVATALKTAQEDDGYAAESTELDEDVSDLQAGLGRSNAGFASTILSGGMGLSGVPSARTMLTGK